MRTQTNRNTMTLKPSKDLNPFKKKILVSLLKELRDETLASDDYPTRHLESVVDCCTMLIEVLEGRYE